LILAVTRCRPTVQHRHGTVVEASSAASLAVPNAGVGMKLTIANLARCRLGEGEADKIFFDDDVPGFGLRVRETGARSWVFQYKMGQKTRRLVIGHATAIKVARAREIAGELHARVKLGGDPAAEKRVQIERSAHTFAALVRRYLDYHKVNVRERTFRETERGLESYAAPLHALPVDTIDQRTIAERLSAVEKSSGAVTSNRVRAAMSAMFSWGMREGLAFNNPVANTNKREERSRDRVLSDAELRLMWQALPKNEYGTIVRLLILTGQRVNEIAALRWSEVDLANRVVSLPGERTKNGRPHIVHLGATACDLVKSRLPVDERELVFGRGSGPFSGWSKSKAQLDARIKEIQGRALPHWTLHDIRRTVATGMADIGVQPHIIEAVLNHASGHKGGIAGIYNRASYAKEKAAALARWDEHVASMAGA
jgi:integrase